MPNTIVLRGDGIHKEAVAGGTVTPGYLVERASTGKVVAHSTAAANAAASFAIENELAGKEITEDYVLDEQIYWVHLQPGSEVYALVAASAAAIVIGDYLESAGDGTLRKLAVAAATAQSARASVVARAIEAVDNSGGGSEARIKVEVL